MTNRDLYLKTLLFSNPGKIPFDPGWPRESTLKRWHSEGLPQDVYWWDYVVRGRLNISLPQSKPVPALYPDFRMIP
ncbi:MAG: hypothetical protein FWD71_19740 [Oscillospiraceae bacterium]|nr:hypothetical protein [Oscillospiraceae bacterium]